MSKLTCERITYLLSIFISFIPHVSFFFSLNFKHVLFFKKRKKHAHFVYFITIINKISYHCFFFIGCDFFALTKMAVYKYIHTSFLHVMKENNEKNSFLMKILHQSSNNN